MTKTTAWDRAACTIGRVRDTQDVRRVRASYALLGGPSHWRGRVASDWLGSIRPRAKWWDSLKIGSIRPTMQSAMDAPHTINIEDLSPDARATCSLLVRIVDTQERMAAHADRQEARLRAVRQLMRGLAGFAPAASRTGIFAVLDTLDELDVDPASGDPFGPLPNGGECEGPCEFCNPN